MRTTLRLVLISLFVNGLLACSAVRPISEPSPSSAIAVPTLTSRTITLEDGTSYRYERGVLRVRVNRQAQASATLPLEFHRLPRSPNASGDAPPIFVLKGGPGFEGLEPMMQRDGYYEFFWKRYTDIADVIVIGQRGFGASGPLTCPELPDVTLALVDTQAERADRLRKGMAECRLAYEQLGTDLTAYNVVEMSHDVIDVVDALDYDRLQLLGNSFGSHWGLTVIREHGERISRATFSAIEGFDHTFDSPTGVKDTLARIATSASTANTISGLSSSSRLIERFEVLIKRADDQPIRITFETDDNEPPQTLTIDGDGMRLLSRGFSRGTHWRYLIPTWPRDMVAMLDGDLQGAARRLARWWTSTDLENAAYFSIECGSGVSQRRANALRNDPARSFIGTSTLIDSDLCRDWPSDLGDDFREGFRSDVPVVLIHGDWDTSTPYTNVADVQAMFSEHHFVRVAGGSHGAMREAEEASPAFRQSLLSWVAFGDASTLPNEVMLPPIEWLPVN